MLKRGFLASTAFYASYAHTNSIINRYADAVKEVFALIRNMGDKEPQLDGPICHTGFQRLT